MKPVPAVRTLHTWLLWRRSLTAAVAASTMAIAVGVVGLATDSTHITGAPAWLKPMKFAISIAAYTATVAWLLTYVEGHDWLVRTLAGLTSLSLVAELALIDLQVLRGTTSHFNTATPFDAAVFSAMGVLVGVVFLAAMAIAVLLFRQRLTSPLGAGIRGGLVLSLVGMAEAGLMIRNGGHTVGGRDGGPGWVFTGWSTQHGDLRVAHFVGLHALQVLPAGAWLLSKLTTGRRQHVQRWLVDVGIVAYAGLIGLLTWQAERGEPVRRPGAPVVVAALGWAAACAVAAWTVERGATTRTPTATEGPSLPRQPRGFEG